MEVQLREVLERAWGDMDVVFTVGGVRREDGRTSAEIEAEFAEKERDEVWL